MPKAKPAPKSVPQPAPVAAPVASPVAAQRPGWTAPSVVTPPKQKAKKKSSVSVIPGIVPAQQIDTAYEAKQVLDNAEAEYKALAGAIKEAVGAFAQGQNTTINLPGSGEVAAQVAIKRDSLILKDPEAARQLAGPYFFKWFREEITGVNYVVPPMIAPVLKQALLLPEVQALLRVAGCADPTTAIVEQKVASYAVAEDWTKDQMMLSALMGGDQAKVDALKACVEVDRRSGTSLRFVGTED
jgi:hypothetical protein